MMKITILFLSIALAGCAQLGRPQEQPVKQIENDLYFTTCSGMVETIGTCFQKAKRTCSGTYIVIKDFRDRSGIHRELTFQCKK
jgi:hypothetical protein